MIFNIMSSLVLLIIGLLPFIIIFFYLHIVSLKLDRVTEAIERLEEKYTEKERV